MVGLLSAVQSHNTRETRVWFKGAVVVLREVVHDGVTELDLHNAQVSTSECAHPAPKITHDHAKLDVRLHVGYISPPQASIHTKHETSVD